MSLLAGCCVLCLACGGGDNGGGSGSSDAAEHPLRERAVEATKSLYLKGCEVMFACGRVASLGGQALYSSQAECTARFSQREFYEAVIKPDKFPEMCFESFTTLWEACVARLSSMPALSLCEYWDGDEAGFLAKFEGGNIFRDFAECRSAAEASMPAQEVGCYPLVSAFITDIYVAPRRPRGM